MSPVEFEFREKDHCGLWGRATRTLRIFRFRVHGSQWSPWAEPGKYAWVTTGGRMYMGIGSGRNAGKVFRVEFEGRDPMVRG
jgi:hypothetical protein